MDLKYQEPAMGITKTHDWGTSVMYSIPCRCGSPDDEITLEVEADDIHVNVTHYVKVKSRWWVKNDSLYLFRAFWNRVVLTYKLWVRGYVEYQCDTLMTPQQAHNYAHTILRAIEDVQKNFEKNKQKQDA